MGAVGIGLTYLIIALLVITSRSVETTPGVVPPSLGAKDQPEARFLNREVV